MNFFNQQLPPSANAYMESQFAFLGDMSKQLFNTIQKINELNLQVAQNSLQEMMTSTREIMQAQNPYDVLNAASARVQPAADRLRSYQQNLTSIAAGTQAELARTAETHVPATSRTASAFADDVARTAAAGIQRAMQPQGGAGAKSDAGKAQANVH